MSLLNKHMRKLTQKHVEEIFTNSGCELLCKYVNSRTKLVYRCLCGNISTIRLNDFRRGRRCGCGNKRNGDRYRMSIEEIQRIFAEQGCILLSKTYENNHVPVDYICKCGRQSRISVASFQAGRRCFECGKEKNRKPWTKIKNRYKCMLRIVLKSTGRKKNAKTFDMLGYGPKELWEHIESHPNWSKVKDVKWHIDHIFPITAFLNNNILDVKLINSLDNLQPLTEEENIRKRNKYDKEKFRNYLKTKGYDLLYSTQD